MRTILIRNIKCILTTDRAESARWAVDPEIVTSYPFTAALRHSDSDWSKPITLESNVCVNYWGEIRSRSPFPELNAQGVLLLTEGESEALLWRAETDETDWWRDWVEIEPVEFTQRKQHP